jgi:hypothetical protein
MQGPPSPLKPHSPAPANVLMVPARRWAGRLARSAAPDRPVGIAPRIDSHPVGPGKRDGGSGSETESRKQQQSLIAQPFAAFIPKRRWRKCKVISIHGDRRLVSFQQTGLVPALACGRGSRSPVGPILASFRRLAALDQGCLVASGRVMGPSYPEARARAAEDWRANGN